MEMFWFLLMGHLVGDYLLQNSWMAFNKKVSFLPCFAHCTVYTMVVVISLQACPAIDTVPFSLIFWLFMSHWVIDRYEILDWWFNALDISSWNNINAKLENEALIHQAITISFGTLVYTVADNTLHLLMMTYLLYQYY